MKQSRLKSTLAERRSAGRKSMGIFLTCGFPTVEATLPLLNAIERGGADFIELGMPFSDPLAEGVSIQHSSEVALTNGVTISRVLETARSFCSTSETPLVLMGYYNPLLQYGLSNFCQDARSAGVAGLIIPDLPPEEGETLRSAARQNDLDLIHLVAPNTPAERMREIDRLTTGFVYAVSITGVTGSSLGSTNSVNDYLADARANVKNNMLLVGFGIRTAGDAEKLTQSTDGFIVGSALVTHIREAWKDYNDEAERLESVVKFVSGLQPGQQSLDALTAIHESN